MKRENKIKSTVNDLDTMVCITNLFLSPYTFYKVNMLLLYYITLFISESLMIFSVLYDYMTVIYVITLSCYAYVTSHSYQDHKKWT